ncbi:TIGR02099 family protein [Aestuariibacter sp. GS-14]|uniref:YhdP family protein n=1 Tax=Aestuariibacter sp. GS-14 TaxID=2590670 RepID=UPI00112D8E30|nr:YhdP family protein [Aestuariibacter sp. GS-14]TPV57324.1 TIGR02099 family protein [Aestuariibacter sp. GS-14]
MSRFLSVSAYLVRKLWLLSAIVLVLFAVLLSVLRYTLPYLDEEKHLIEDYLSAQYGINLTIDSLSAAWQGTGPSIVLNGVEFTQNDLSPVELRLQQVYVEVDFWQSIQQRELSSKRFDLVGLTAKIDTQRIESGEADDFPIVEALRSLFLDQLQSFSLQHGEVTLVTPTDEQVIELSELVWVNRDERHQGRGEIRVQELTNNSASFILDLFGDKSSLQGTLYAKGEALDISPWVSALLPTRSPVEESRGNFELWASLNENQVTAVQVNFDESDIAWRIADDSALQSHIRGGSIQAIPANDGWSIRIDQLVLQSGKHTLVTDLVGRADNNGNALFNTVKPLTLSPLLSLTPLFLSEDGGELINRLQPEAELATLQLQWQDKQFSAVAKVVDMQWHQSGHVPGVNSLDAEFYWYQDHGVLELDASDVAFSVNNLLPQDIDLARVKGRAYVFADSNQNWQLWIDRLAVDGELVSFTQALHYQFANKHLSTTLNVSKMPLIKVPQLFPSAYMGEGTVSYLNRAFSGAGEVDQATVIWHGAVDAFPFTQNQGIFQASVAIKDAEFTFSDQWPALKKLNMDLLFENESLHMRSDASQLGAIQLTDLRAKIPRLTGSSILSIDANGAGTGQSLAGLMLASSMKESLGKVLAEDVVVSGSVNAKLHLDIPLSGEQVSASGIATLNKNQVVVTSLDLAFTNTSGEVVFDNANITLNGVTAELTEQPVAIQLTGSQLSDEYLLDIHLTGNWATQPLIARFNPAFDTYVSGRSNWQTDVSVSLSKNGFQYHATLNSDLHGVASRLPAPFNKASTDLMPLMVLAEGNEQATNVSVNVGSEVRFNGVLPHVEKQFSRAHLALGNSDFVGLGVGFSISADLAKVDVADWYKAIELLVGGFTPATGNSETARKPYFSVPERIFIEAENLVVFDQILTGVDITAKQQNNNWLLDVSSSQAKAEVRLYDAWLEQGIDIKADFIHLTEWKEKEGDKDKKKNNTSETVKYQYKPAELPPIRFHCGNCVLLDKDFGEVDVEVVRVDDGMRFKQLSAKNTYGAIQMSGAWLTQGNAESTRLEGNVNSRDVGAFLNLLGVNSGIKDSAAEVAFVLDWQDSPFNFSMASLNGNINTQLTDGYLTQVSDKGSRIFTLFSLNSLVRKLSLDFRDVFAKGFFYDDIQGSLQIVDGVATTNDTLVDGGAGEIEITGYTNLAEQTLNYNVSFAPNVTGNLPFLVYFMVNPPTALAALALDQVLTSAKVISNVNYHITGTIDEPVLEEVGRDSKDIALPAQQLPGERQAPTPTESDSPVIVPKDSNDADS